MNNTNGPVHNLDSICLEYAKVICKDMTVHDRDLKIIAKNIQDTSTFVCLDEDGKWMFLSFEQAEYMLSEGVDSVFPIIELDHVVGEGFGTKK